jgi:hypothetical protein
MFFVILIADASNVVLTLNNHQQSFYYVSFIIENCITFNVYFHNLNFIILGVELTKLFIIQLNMFFTIRIIGRLRRHHLIFL